MAYDKDGYNHKTGKWSASAPLPPQYAKDGWTQADWEQHKAFHPELFEGGKAKSPPPPSAPTPAVAAPTAAPAAAPSLKAVTAALKYGGSEVDQVRQAVAPGTDVRRQNYATFAKTAPAMAEQAYPRQQRELDDMRDAYAQASRQGKLAAFVRAIRQGATYGVRDEIDPNFRAQLYADRDRFPNAQRGGMVVGATLSPLNFVIGAQFNKWLNAAKGINPAYPINRLTALSAATGAGIGAAGLDPGPHSAGDRTRDAAIGAGLGAVTMRAVTPSVMAATDAALNAPRLVGQPSFKQVTRPVGAAPASLARAEEAIASAMGMDEARYRQRFGSQPALGRVSNGRANVNLLTTPGQDQSKALTMAALQSPEGMAAAERQAQMRYGIANENFQNSVTAQPPNAPTTYRLRGLAQSAISDVDNPVFNQSWLATAQQQNPQELNQAVRFALKNAIEEAERTGQHRQLFERLNHPEVLKRLQAAGVNTKALTGSSTDLATARELDAAIAQVKGGGRPQFAEGSDDNLAIGQPMYGPDAVQVVEQMGLPRPGYYVAPEPPGPLLQKERAPRSVWNDYLNPRLPYDPQKGEFQKYPIVYGKDGKPVKIGPVSVRAPSALATGYLGSHAVAAAGETFGRDAVADAVRRSEKKKAAR